MARTPAARTKKASAPAKKPPAKVPARKTAPSNRSKTTASVARPARTNARAAKRTGAASSFALDKLHQVALQATNLDEAVNFYRDVLGLHFIARLDPPGVGRGRIVASAFRLSGDLTSQPGFDELFNAFVLRRPPRCFTENVLNKPPAKATPDR